MSKYSNLHTSAKNVDAVIVGAGFAGSVMARELADAGMSVLIIDKRSHIGGNAHDSLDENGVLIHHYGPHIFHTNSEKIFRWLSKFTDWRFYEHRVLAKVDEQLLPIPINRTTINRLYGLDLDEAGVSRFLEQNRVPREALKTSEDVVLNSVGPDLCEKFFRGYTRKQWGLDLSELSAGVASRIPTRTNDDDRYFADTYQFMPLHGYNQMFERMLRHPNIRIELGVNYFDVKEKLASRTLVYCGPIDEYFGFCHGKLPYRSLIFKHEHYPEIERHQAVGTVNYPNDHAYTRITEFKHLTGQTCAGTSVVSEFPASDGDPYYPIPRPENETLFKKYQELGEGEVGTFFVGRLAQYKYFNMDQVVGSALHASRKVLDYLMST